jgi:hypothetical protein
MAASLFWLAALFAPLNLTDDWAQFRGRNATGHAVIATQFEWDEKDGIRLSLVIRATELILRMLESRMHSPDT